MRCFVRRPCPCPSPLPYHIPILCLHGNMDKMRFTIYFGCDVWSQCTNENLTQTRKSVLVVLIILEKIKLTFAFNVACMVLSRRKVPSLHNHSSNSHDWDSSRVAIIVVCTKWFHFLNCWLESSCVVLFKHLKLLQCHLHSRRHKYLIITLLWWPLIWLIRWMVCIYTNDGYLTLGGWSI